MKDREFRKLKAGTARAALAMVSVLGLAFAAAVSVCAQEAPATSSPPGQVVTAYLDYQDAGYSYMNLNLPVVLKSSAFKKEPAFSQGKVVRGALRMGGSSSNEVAFAWDRTARKLYVDLNRNVDLTDDPDGVFISVGASADSFQIFNGVRLPLKTETGSRQMLVDLSFYDYGSSPNCTAALRSFWHGKVALRGEEWQVGLLTTPTDQRVPFEGDSLLLRPWAQRNKPFSLHSGTMEAFPFSRNVFFGNQAYQLQCTNEIQGDSVRVRMQFTEQAPKLGELKIAGEFVERVTLERGPYLVLIDKPGATVKVPVGSYTQTKVCLKKGEAEACLDVNSTAAAGRITVSENKLALLNAGGPLTNSVSVIRRGKNLTMGYRLAGVGGVYQLVNQDRSHPPEFTIYQGDKKVASGKFEFG
jgi:hypothetical protein